MMFEPPNDFCHSLLICSGLDEIEQKNVALTFIVEMGLACEFAQFLEELLEGQE